MLWICNRCTASFSVGAQRCPEQSCGAQDAHEQGGDRTVNVFVAFDLVNALAKASLYGPVEAAENEVAERLGDVDVVYGEPSDTPGQDTSTSETGQT